MAKKKNIETKQQEIIRRLEEYIEFAESLKRFHDVAFYKDVINFILTHKNN